LKREASRPEWAVCLEQDLGTPIRSFRSVSGGDAAASYRVELASHEHLFVKSYGLEPIGVGYAEAAGLEWLREADALRVPEVLAKGPCWLALEWIDSAPRCSDFAERLGRGLAKLHSRTVPNFGFPEDNWIASTPQVNTSCETWARFYTECRLAPLTELAARRKALPRRVIELVGELMSSMADRVGRGEEPARLHGDLWSGNVIADERGRPCLIDPAVYAGDREVDLAMMRLFGGFDSRTFEAYTEAHPLEPGAAERVPLYQVYPLLVHVCLFGEAYLERLEETLRRALAPSSSNSA
jgi:fructosamine-3-kinase